MVTLKNHIKISVLTVMIFFNKIDLTDIIQKWKFDEQTGSRDINTIRSKRNRFIGGMVSNKKHDPEKSTLTKEKFRDLFVPRSTDLKQKHPEDKKNENSIQLLNILQELTRGLKIPIFIVEEISEIIGSIIENFSLDSQIEQYSYNELDKEYLRIILNSMFIECEYSYPID